LFLPILNNALLVWLGLPQQGRNTEGRQFLPGR